MCGWMQISVVVGENSTRVPNGFCLPLSLVIAAASRCHNIYQRESERDERERERDFQIKQHIAISRFSKDWVQLHYYSQL